MSNTMEFTEAPSETPQTRGNDDLSFTELTDVVTASPYSLLMSVLHDDIGSEGVERTHQFLQAMKVEHFTAIAAAIVRVGQLGKPDESYVIVEKGNRLAVAKAAPAIGAGANFSQVHAAAISHGISTTEELAFGWVDGGRKDTNPLPKGLPVYDESTQFHAKLVDFATKVKYSATVGTVANPVSVAVHSWMKTNVDNVIKRSQPHSEATIQASVHALTRSGDLTDKIKNVVQSASPTEDPPFPSGNALLSVLRTRLSLMKAARQGGRNARGTDNHAAVTSHWYRYPGVPKAIARYIYVNELTGGTGVSKCNVEAISVALSDKDGWNLYMDPQGGRTFDAWKADIRGRGMLEEDDRMKEKCAAMFDLGSLADTELVAFARFMNVNGFSVGWSLHDGHVFVVPAGVGFSLQKLPYFLAQCVWCNNARTLYSQSPLSRPEPVKWGIDSLAPVKLRIGGIEDFSLTMDTTRDSETETNKRAKRE